MHALVSSARATLRARIEMLRLLAGVGHAAVAGTIAIWTAGVLLPLGFIVATGVLVGAVPDAVGAGLGSPAGHRLLTALAVVGALFVAMQIVGVYQFLVLTLVHRRVNGGVRERLMRASLGARTIGHLEDGKMRDLLARAAKVDWRTPGGAASGLVLLVPRYLQAIGGAVLIGIAFSWWVGLVLLAVGVTMRVRYQRRLLTMWRSWEEQSGSWRESAYLADLALRPGAAKELRLFGLADWVRERYRERWLAAVAPSWVADRRGVMAEVGRLYVVGALAGAGAVALAGRAAIDGDVSVGQLAVVAQSAFAVLMLSQTNAYADQQLLFGMVAVPALQRFERETAALAQGDAGAPADGMPAREIRCEGLRFAYPGSRREVLRGLDLSIRAGESLAIVGLNGAGKTTLVKLLAGLYEPTGGRIAIDGTDLAALDARTWRRRIAVIFQDFVRYELPARENIRFGALHHSGGDEAIRRVAALAGAGEPLAGLPLGLDTTLARGYERGADLSGGEWQRVALARALYAVDAGAGVLVLDEPTANLDVRAEAALFDRFLELTANVTTILISHRFSTVRHADRICVLEHGCVTEQGTHAELAAAGGRYAEMFRLQASRFEESVEGLDA